MFQSIYQDLKQQYQRGDIITRLVIVNCIVFVVINLVAIGFRWIVGAENGFSDVIQFFQVSDSWMHNLTHPWVIITHMFLHMGFLHLLFNMLFLYWFGNIVKDLSGGQRILPIYLLGGLTGAIFFFIATPLIYGDIGVPIYAMGASAAVMALVMAAAVTAPDYVMHLILIGPVRLKYIAAIMIFLDLIGASGFQNTGGHFGHLGGVFFGWLYVTQLRRGVDLGKPVERLLERIFAFFDRLLSGPSRPGPKVAYRNPKARQQATRPRRSRSAKGQAASDTNNSHQAQIDAILDKIKESGYDSLSEVEREFLFNASKKDK